jgi:hypothetical protein
MKSIRVLCAAAAVLSMTAAAMAQGAPNVKEACAADMQKLCPGISDRHAARQCMRSHMADVSPDCRSAFEAAKAARAERKDEAPSSGGPPPAGAPATADPH